jgi:dTDP-L-rhamnose 4-epimerase
LLKDVEVVFHLASMVGVGQSMYQITRYVDCNIGGAAQVLQALVAGDHGVKKLIVASSMSIYGEGAYDCSSCGLVYPPLRPQVQLAKKEWEMRCPNCGNFAKPTPTGENKPPAPNSVYAVTKRDQEELCLTTGRAFGIPTVALRFFGVYGPRQSLDNPYTGVCAIFQSRIKNGKPPVIFEDGEQSRDFVSVHDVVQACGLAMERSAADGQALNVGSGQRLTVNEVARVLLKLYGRGLKPRVEHKFRAGDVRHCYADINRARELLGYAPKISFEEGMRELAEWGRGQDAVDRFDEAYQELRSQGLVDE